jgi:hypothetical protein
MNWRQDPRQVGERGQRSVGLPCGLCPLSARAADSSFQCQAREFGASPNTKPVAVVRLVRSPPFQNQGTEKSAWTVELLRMHLVP